jgi:hypothetical protein
MKAKPIVKLCIENSYTVHKSETSSYSGGGYYSRTWTETYTNKHVKPADASSWEDNTDDIISLDNTKPL